jgi:hypothetical protein
LGDTLNEGALTARGVDETLCGEVERGVDARLTLGRRWLGEAGH